MLIEQKWARRFFMADGEGGGGDSAAAAALAAAAGGKGGEGGGSGGGDPAAAAAAAAAQNNGGGKQEPSPFAWVGDNAELQALAQQRGWKDPATAIESYRNLEKTFSAADKIVLPKEEGDKDGWGKVYKALGRPDTADGYQIPVAKGGSAEDLKVFQTKAHELGLTQKQAAELAKWYDGDIAARTDAAGNQSKQQLDVEIAQVKDNWGSNYQQNAEIARRGSDLLGFTAADIDKLESTIGHKKTMDMFLKVGQGSKEGRFVDGDGTKFNPATKEAAQARLDEIRNSDVERSEALKQGSDTFKEVERLSKIVAGVKV